MILCAPSWLEPGTWLQNVELARTLPWLQGLELLFFAYDAEARATLGRELPGIRAAATRLALSVHLPDPLSPADEDLVAATADFAQAYVLHPPRSDGEAGAWTALVAGLRERHGHRFLLEYTGAAAFERAERLLPGLPLCADSGRLLLDGFDPLDWIRAHGDRVREVHLHACLGEKDHAPLRVGEAWLGRLAPFLAASSLRVVLELFSLEGVEASAAALAEVLRPAPASAEARRPMPPDAAGPASPLNQGALP